MEASKAKCINRLYGAGDGNRTRVRSLGSYSMSWLPFPQSRQPVFRTRTFSGTRQALSVSVRFSVEIKEKRKAGAIDFFGRRYRFPPALRGHQTYFVWGPRGYSGNCLIVLNDTKENLEHCFEHVEYVGMSDIRRECLDPVIVFHECSLRRTLDSYSDYYHRSRTHLSLGKDSPEPRPMQPSEMGSVAAAPQVGGLHHRDERRAA